MPKFIRSPRERRSNSSQSTPYSSRWKHTYLGRAIHKTYKTHKTHNSFPPEATSICWTRLAGSTLFGVTELSLHGTPCSALIVLYKKHNPSLIPHLLRYRSLPIGIPPRQLFFAYSFVCLTPNHPRTKSLPNSRYHHHILRALHLTPRMTKMKVLEEGIFTWESYT